MSNEPESNALSEAVAEADVDVELTEEEIGVAFEAAEAAEKDDNEDDNPTETKETKEPEATVEGTALDGKSTPTAVYQVIDDKNEVDWKQSFTKISDAYQSLSSKLGSRNRPETIDGYEVTLDKDAGEDATDSMKRFLTKSHDLDFSVEQVTGIREFLSNERKSAREQAPSRAAESVTSGLQQSWGKDYQKNIGFAQAAAVELELDMTNPTIGNNKPLIEILARLGPKFKEDTTITQASGNTNVSEEEFAKLTAPVTKNGVELTILDVGHPYWTAESQKKANEYYEAQGATSG